MKTVFEIIDTAILTEEIQEIRKEEPMSIEDGVATWYLGDIVSGSYGSTIPTQLAELVGFDIPEDSDGDYSFMNNIDNIFNEYSSELTETIFGVTSPYQIWFGYLEADGSYGTFYSETAEIYKTDNPRIYALHLVEDIPVDELVELEYDELNIGTVNGNKEWLVVTDEEADEKWEEDLDNYIDECILPELPKQYQNYFDCEAFKSDAKYDGRARTLGRYDGEEQEITFDFRGERYEFYIYRQN